MTKTELKKKSIILNQDDIKEAVILFLLAKNEKALSQDIKFNFEPFIAIIETIEKTKE